MVMHVSIAKAFMSLRTESVKMVYRHKKELECMAQYLKCMSDKKTLKETAKECFISARPPLSFVT